MGIDAMLFLKMNLLVSKSEWRIPPELPASEMHNGNDPGDAPNLACGIAELEPSQKQQLN